MRLTLKLLQIHRLPIQLELQRVVSQKIFQPQDNLKVSQAQVELLPQAPQVFTSWIVTPTSRFPEPSNSKNNKAMALGQTTMPVLLIRQMRLTLVLLMPAQSVMELSVSTKPLPQMPSMTSPIHQIMMPVQVPSFRRPSSSMLIMIQQAKS